MVGFSSSSTQFRRILRRAPRRHIITTVLAAAALAACGGGGGSAPGPVAVPDVAQPSGGDSTNQSSSSGSTADAAPTPLYANAQAFSFAAQPALAQAGGLDAFGGALVAGWDVQDAKHMMAPGMKVVFYGTASGCASSAANGPVSAGDAGLRATALTKAGLPSSDSSMTWSPTAGAAGCSTPNGATNGGAYAAINPAAANGGMALYTPTGPDAVGSAPFFQPYGASGQDGAGSNAFITGTFVSFRQDWSASNSKQPWSGRGDGSATAARLRSTQSVTTADVGADPGTSTAVQVKQQMMMTIINKACASQAAPTAQRPCQIQYLLDTAIVRTGVSDWSSVVWYQNGTVQFDPVQGGMPIVEGPIQASGTTTVDGATGLPLFTSQGTATQHAPFGASIFDVQVSFAELQNVLHVITGKKLGVAPSALASADLAGMWGPQYADPTAWSLVSTDVAQEAYNPLAATHRSAIGGVVKDLYVGPQF